MMVIVMISDKRKFITIFDSDRTQFNAKVNDFVQNEDIVILSMDTHSTKYFYETYILYRETTRTGIDENA